MKLDTTKEDIYIWVNQAKMYLEKLEEHRRAMMLMMLIDQSERKAKEVTA